MDAEHASHTAPTITKHTRAKVLDVSTNSISIQSVDGGGFRITVDGRELHNVTGFRLSGEAPQAGVYKLSVDLLAVGEW